MYMPVYYTCIQYVYSVHTTYTYTIRISIYMGYYDTYVCVSRTRAPVFVTVLISVLLAVVVRPPPRTTVTSCKMTGVALTQTNVYKTR